MGVLETILPATGIAICVLAMLQMAYWSGTSLTNIFHNQNTFRKQHRQFRQRLNQKTDNLKSISADEPFHWKGYRDFRVKHLQKETDHCTSVYLTPADAKPIASFRPGQHLTFRFQIPGISKPVVRCYSLSAGPGQSSYRISVKQALPPHNRPDLPPGKASQYINQHLQVGNRVEVKAPAGSFYLNSQSNRPVVMLAGGIGITPMISMIEQLIADQADRLMVLVYGIRHSGDHAFSDYLAGASEQNQYLHVLNCYSHPLDQDREAVDYHSTGYVSIDLLKKVLPSQDCDFYMCGPPPFMDSLYNGLTEWGVSEDQIHFEAFGPATVGKSKQDSPSDQQKSESAAVKFVQSDIDTVFDSTSSTLLELAEANGIEIDSGCRSGNCGTCSTELLQGSVEYTVDQEVECEPGHCLVCVARPKGDIELRA